MVWKPVGRTPYQAAKTCMDGGENRFWENEKLSEVTEERVDEHIIYAQFLGRSERSGSPVSDAFVELGEDIAERVFWPGGWAQIDP